MTRGIGLLLALTLTIAAPAVRAEATYRIIVHPDNPTESLSKKQVSQFLLKELSHWPHRVAVEPVDLDSKSLVRASFSKEVHGRSVSSIKNYWQRQIFTDRTVPPPEVSSDAEVIAFVASRPGAIGYVSREAEIHSVRLVKVSAAQE